MKLSSVLKKIIAVILLVAFFVALNLTGFYKTTKNFFYFFSAPIQQFLWRTGNNFSDFFETVLEINNLKKENEDLKKANQELLAENSLLKELKKDDESLRQALDIGLEKEFRVIFVHITGKDLSSDSIFINKGSKDGIKKDLPVITPQKILVGKVSQVYDNFSEVVLASNKKSSFDVKIQPKNVSGLLRGKGNLQIQIDLIPLDKEVAINDTVVTSFLGGIFPEGILIGHIKSIKKNALEPFQQAEITAEFDLKEIDQLFVILEK